MLVELERQQAQLLAQHPIAFFVRCGECSPLLLKGDIGLFEQLLCFVGKGQFLPLPIELLHPFEERLVQVDGIGLFRQFRRDPLRDLHQFIIRLGTQHVEERIADPIQEFATSFKCLDGVGERWRFGIVGNSLDLLLLLPDALFESRFVVFRTDPVKRRRPERSIKSRQKRILIHLYHDYAVLYIILYIAIYGMQK